MLRFTRYAIAVMFAITLFAPSLSAQAAVSTNPHFDRTWERTDRPLAEGQVSRTWMWGPQPFTQPMSEPYDESPGGFRTVQYFDKARMEITTPSADPNSIWYVTNGLLVVELISGDLQTGHSSFEPRSSAQVNVAGDADDPTGPTYATFAGLLDATPLWAGSVVTQRVSRDGSVSNDTNLSAANVTVTAADELTGHSIAQPFWNFMNSSGVVYEGGYTTANLFENPYFATGRPITEPYWANVKVAGTYQDVLLQCFERRCLTYNPQNTPEWQVEAGNVGQHYFAWRHGQTPPSAPQPPQPSTDPPMSELEYLEALIVLTDDFVESLEWFNFLVDIIDVLSPAWIDLFTDEMDVWRSFEPRAEAMNPPPVYEAGHAKIVEGFQILTDAANLLEEGVLELDTAKIEEATPLLSQAIDTVSEGIGLITGNEPPVDPAPIEPPPTEPPPPPPPTEPPPSTGCVNINTASFEDLQQIIHIGPDRASQIISLRPFSSVDQLTRVDGIGPARLADIKAQGLACV